jgi:hypothetical protein
MLPIFTKLFNIILDTGIIHNSWSKDYIIKKFKGKGNTDLSENYIDRTDFENLVLYKMLEAFCSISGIFVYFTYLRYVESDKGGYQTEKLDLDH